MAARTRRRRGAVREAKQALYRRLVLEAAERVFAEKGYDDAKMEEIGRESGLALGTLYSVFAGKAGIFRALHEAADRELLARAAACVRGVRDPLDALLAGVRAYTEYFLEHPDLLRMHLREGLSWGIEGAGAGSRERTEAWRAGVEMLTHAVARCIESGVFVESDPRLVARTMIAMQQVQLAHWVETGMRTPPEQVVREMGEQVERAFRRSQEGPRDAR
jgi:AcrR family transcriptional regulator